MSTDVDSITIGVVIVAFGSEPVLPSCLEHLAKSMHRNLKVVVCDNASPDASADIVRRRGAEADGSAEGGFLEVEAKAIDGMNGQVLPPLVLVTSPANVGFAGGVNIGLRILRQDPEVDLFWVLNPDTEVTAATASAYAQKAVSGKVGLMGGRTLYREPPHRIQSDGGRVGRWSGICRNVNQGVDPEHAVAPSGDSLDFLMGANIVASRDYLDQAGLMQEDYFLYYEEVDWAFRRGALPLDFLADAVVYHHGGTAIGTGNTQRRASPFANFFNYRNRMWFMARFKLAALPVAYVISMLKIAKLLSVCAWDEAYAAFCGLNQLPPPKAVAAKLGPDAAVLAFGRKTGRG